MSGFVELTIEQNANFSTVINLKDSTNATLNLSGYSVASQMRKSYYSSTATDFTIAITDLTTGEITMTMPSATTANLTPGRYVYDVLLTSSTGVKTRVIEGIITIMPSVTR
jgi:hypothetical protein